MTTKREFSDEEFDKLAEELAPPQPDALFTERLILQARAERDELWEKFTYVQAQASELFDENAKLEAERDTLARQIERLQSGATIESDYLDNRDDQLLAALNERDAALARVTELEENTEWVRGAIYSYRKPTI